MALIKFSALVSGMSGKLNGSKIYKGRSGGTVTNKVKPTNRNTAAQIGVRSYLRYFSGLWKTIGASSIAAWNSYGLGISRKNRVGDVHHESGFNAFIQENARAKYLNSSAADVTLPPAQTAPTLNGNIANPVAVGGSTQTFVLDIPLVSTGDKLVISATPCESAGKTFVKGKFRPILRESAGAAQTAASIVAAYTAEFGALVTGKNVWLRCEYFSVAGSKIPHYIGGADIKVLVS